MKGWMLAFSASRTLMAVTFLGALEIAVFTLSGYDLSPVLGPVLRVLLGVLIAQGAVLTAWNALAGLSSLRNDWAERDYQRTVRQLERRQAEAEAAQAFAERMEPGIRAMQQAMLAGTYSVNGVRYQAAHLSGPGSLSSTDGKALPGRLAPPGRVSKSECDGCGYPLDVAWCAPGASYLCRTCREREIFPQTNGWA